MCDWFSGFIYTTQLQTMLEFMQGITKQVEKTVPAVCPKSLECEGQQGQSGVCKLFREQLPKVLRAKTLRFNCTDCPPYQLL